MTETEIELIYKKYFNDVYKYLLSICRNNNLAEEITQETFFKAMKNIDDFKGNCTIYVWLCQIAKYTYLSYQKKHQYSSEELEDVHCDFRQDIERAYLDKTVASKLHVQLHNLEEPYKEVFTLRVFGELRFKQIGALFGKTDSWARLIFYRAKKQLQEAMR